MTEAGYLTPCEYTGTGSYTCSKCGTFHRSAQYTVNAFNDEWSDPVFRCNVCRAFTTVPPEKVEHLDN